MAPLLVGAGAPPEWRPRFLVSLRSVCRGTRQQHAVLDAVGGHARRPRHVDGAPAEALPPPDASGRRLHLLPPHALPEVPQVSQEAAQRKKR
ncbi:hypothetical protein TNIN_453661 [Trichonephila inaurata madagascariensis]|uniref:Uncharacterized protein n=1 Tax=Trichonephila inaurata madagascariensis TaxID=2747483 RepID=A0A8X6XLV5_9ARAC|nr:hypothetical protein TNIN_453661 [Trichonephila inaurata madagascariensis]